MRRCAALLIALPMACGLMPFGVAHATQQGTAVLLRWKQMDVCQRKAQLAFPDYTAESNAKRDAQVKRCLATEILPPPVDMSQPGH